MKKCISRRITPDIAVFLAAVLFSAVVTWFVTGSCIDSDASSELILAQHLAQTGQLNWPVPILVCAGLALIIAGSLLLRWRKQES